jgi:preprotein translocase subunit SecG
MGDGASCCSAFSVSAVAAVSAKIIIVFAIVFLIISLLNQWHNERHINRYFSGVVPLTFLKAEKKDWRFRKPTIKPMSSMEYGANRLSFK